eukprot:351138-Chlamydomonas_euryale.AAC.5
MLGRGEASAPWRWRLWTGVNAGGRGKRPNVKAFQGGTCSSRAVVDGRVWDMTVLLGGEGQPVAPLRTGVDARGCECGLHSAVKQTRRTQNTRGAGPAARQPNCKTLGTWSGSAPTRAASTHIRLNPEPHNPKPRGAAQRT